MKKIEVAVGMPVVYYHDIDSDGDLDPFYFIVGEILSDGWLNLAPMAQMDQPPGFENPVPYAPVPVERHWTHRIDEDD